MTTMPIKTTNDAIGREKNRLGAEISADNWHSLLFPDEMLLVAFRNIKKFPGVQLNTALLSIIALRGRIKIGVLRKIISTNERYNDAHLIETPFFSQNVSFSEKISKEFMSEGKNTKHQRY